VHLGAAEINRSFPVVCVVVALMTNGRSTHIFTWPCGPHERTVGNGCLQFRKKFTLKEGGGATRLP